jgi:hypothetical protein
MPIFIVPFDYDETADRLTVPICISDTDSQGNRVHFGWVERGVVPVASELVQLAGRVLKDKWRASEIAEPVVHQLSRDFGTNLGIEPSTRVLDAARWCAKDLEAGGRRARCKKEVELLAHTLESLQDQVDFARSIAAKHTLDRLVAQLIELEMDDVLAMVPMMLRECEAERYQRQFNKSRNAITQQFYRGMRKAARVAGII